MLFGPHSKCQFLVSTSMRVSKLHFHPNQAVLLGFNYYLLGTHSKVLKHLETKSMLNSDFAILYGFHCSVETFFANAYYFVS